MLQKWVFHLWWKLKHYLLSVGCLEGEEFEFKE